MSAPRSCFEILAELERLSGGLHHETPPAIPSERTIRRLQATVAQLSQTKKARPVKCPPNYIELWNAVGASRPFELPSRAVRYLSWETDIAVRPAFQSVALQPERITARSLQGLVRSVHRRWDSTVNTTSVGNLVVALTTYPKKNALIDKWKQNLGFVLNKDGPPRVAADVLNRNTTWEKVSEEWGLEPDTEFGDQVLCQCVAQSVSGRGGDAFQNATIRFVLPSKHWKPSSLKTSVEQMVIACSRSSQQQPDMLKDFILSDSRFLDPRLPANSPNWIGISDSAKDTVIQWLSAEDIQLFFDHVLTKGNDPHGRKPFWLRYKGKVKRSRPLLSAMDESRWQANTVTRGKRNFGRMDYFCNTSAFLLDFGRVIVAEFSQVGNAVYVYQHRDVPDLNDSFWSQARFSLNTLKQKDCCVERMTHTPLWQSKMRTLLAQFGIHPGT
jgi:EH signature protein